MGIAVLMEIDKKSQMPLATYMLQSILGQSPILLSWITIVMFTTFLGKNPWPNVRHFHFVLQHILLASSFSTPTYFLFLKINTFSSQQIHS